MKYEIFKTSEDFEKWQTTGDYEIVNITPMVVGFNGSVFSCGYGNFDVSGNSKIGVFVLYKIRPVVDYIEELYKK